jgi:hypothetical protein
MSSSKKQHQGTTLPLLAKVVAAALLMQLDFSAYTVNAWSLKGMLGIDEQAQP